MTRGRAGPPRSASTSPWRRLSDAGIEAKGEMMDPDPYMAVKDELGDHRADEIIISTLP